MEVYENAGTISLCVAILRPTDLSRIEYATFSIRVYTRSISGNFCNIKFQHAVF